MSVACTGSNSVLSDYEYVQQCLNLDRDIRFIIVDVDSIQKPFRRMVCPFYFFVGKTNTFCERSDLSCIRATSRIPQKLFWQTGLNCSISSNICSCSCRASIRIIISVNTSFNIRVVSDFGSVSSKPRIQPFLPR